MRRKFVMIDLETLGTTPGSAVLTIGAVLFSLTVQEDGKIVKSIEQKKNWRVDLESCLKLGMTVDGSTLRWWMQQSEEAQADAFLDEGRLSLKTALLDFSNFYTPLTLGSHVPVFSKGSSFDFPILKKAYSLVGVHYPIRYTEELDCRTLFALFYFLSSHWGQVSHTAGDDAERQALALMDILGYLALQFGPSFLDFANYGVTGYGTGRKKLPGEGVKAEFLKSVLALRGLETERVRSYLNSIELSGDNLV